jgi:hypothetical protein
MSVEKYRRFYEIYLGPLPEANDQGEIQVRSCFRHDPNPSMFINLEDGRYNDFGGDNGGDAYNFYIHMHDASFSAAKKAVDELVGAPEEAIIKVPMPIEESKVEQWHKLLLSSKELLGYLTQTRGINLEVIKKRKLGFDGTRYTIPVYNKYGLCVNVRRYLPSGSGGNKMVNFSKGYGAARLYPLDALSANVVFLQEGEFDALLQETHGFNALTNTGGSGTWKREWNDLFKGKIVYICYDCDQAGKDGAEKVANHLLSVADKVFVIELPLEFGTGDDVTDWYQKYEKTTDDFMAVVSGTQEFTASDEVKDSDEHIHRVDLHQARNSTYKHKKVQFDVMVVGKDTAPYNIPEKIQFNCSMVGINDKMCAQCQLARCGGELDLAMAKDPEMLELIRSSKQQQQGLLKRKAGIPNNCSFFQNKDISSVNIEEVLMAPEIQSFAEWQADGTKYLLQSGFMVDVPIDANRSYKVRGVMTPDPWQQHVTFVLTDAEPLQDSVTSFKLTPEIRKRLEVYQTDDVRAKFDEIHTDYVANITHIYGRDDLLAGLDLVYHSALSFYFQDVFIQKGWLELLCIGDTRTGKSETTEKLLSHYGLGEISVAENTSYAGLVGGLQQTGDKRWFLTWGKLPLNDGRLFVIDEASGLSQDDIGKMSGIRSSGIAEVTKIQTERTTARTRMIWLSNPRSGKHLSYYSYGVEAIRELIGRAEDISRFDFAISASRNEVPMDRINSKRTEADNVPHVFTSELSKLLILWTWSRKPEQVIFEDDAVDAVLKYATIMGKEYTSSIPLVEGANQRIKLARLAVATAARVFSCDESGENIVVKKQHIDFAYSYLDEIYSKPSLDYRGYSERELGDIEVAETHRDSALDYLNKFEGVADIFDRQEYVWPKHLEEQLGCERQAAQEHISFFTSTRMIIDSNNRGYKKTPAFIQLLREWKQTRLKRKREEHMRE